jgi:hypothetical protein
VFTPLINIVVPYRGNDRHASVALDEPKDAFQPTVAYMMTLGQVELTETRVIRSKGFQNRAVLIFHQARQCEGLEARQTL